MRLTKVLRLATRDYGHEWQMSGCFVLALAAVLGPMLVPACETVGFEPVQAALVVVVGFLLGTVTPPVGVCYFTANAIAGARLERTAVALLPFLAVEVLMLVLMLFIAPLTLALPRLFGLI